MEDFGGEFHKIRWQEVPFATSHAWGLKRFAIVGNKERHGCRIQWKTSTRQRFAFLKPKINSSPTSGSGKVLEGIHSINDRFLRRVDAGKSKRAEFSLPSG